MLLTTRRRYYQLGGVTNNYAALPTTIVRYYNQGYFGWVRYRNWVMALPTTQRNFLGVFLARLLVYGVSRAVILVYLFILNIIAKSEGFAMRRF